MSEENKTVEQINKVSETVSKITHDIKECANAGRELKKALEFASKFEKLAGIAAGLGLIGGGFALIGIVTDLMGESDTEKILNAISKLSHQVTELGDRMDTQFKKMEAVVREVGARDQLLPAMAYFDGLKGNLEALQNVKDKSSESAKMARDELRKYNNNTDLITNTQIIVLTMKQSIGNNILESLYTRTYGDIKGINHVAGVLMSYLVFAAQAHGTILGLGKNETEMKSFTLDHIDIVKQNIEANHKSGLEEAQLAWTTVLKKCIDHSSENIENKAKESIDNAPNRGDHENTAQYIEIQLRNQFFWKDWLVIVYNDISGFEEHACMGNAYKSIFHYRDLNTVVAYIDNTLSTKGRGKNRPELTNMRCMRRHFNKNITTFEHVIQPAEEMENLLSYAPLLESVESDKLNYNIERMYKNLVTPMKDQGFLWRCKRQRGVYAACATFSSDRFVWKNGNDYTVCIFE